ncbi:MAG: UDP-N-acetylmuramate dehydrogenase [Oscillospiraceae bacterium]|nr:UDP-N-acetylmuramate dehydrogenase [Oscillospiraceae bacterium]
MDVFSHIREKYLSRFPDGETLEYEPMEKHTSFRIGGPARLMLLPKTAEELCFALALTAETGVRRLVMGNGTDLLVSDAPLDIAVIKTHDGLSGITAAGEDTIEAGCGALLSRVASFACAQSLAGLEFAQGIPGTLGGGLFMNAGAYGGEMKDVLLSVTAADGNGRVREISAEDCRMSYRHSVFSEEELIALSARLKLAPGEPDAIRARMEELAEKRRASQPLNMPSAGSTFKRPVGGYAAALIDEAGLKGFAVGGAQVSEKHAGFVVNTGGATFGDVMRLMEHVKETVYERSGVTLEPEVRIIA